MIDVNKYNIRQLLNILRDTGLEENTEKEVEEKTEEAIIIPIQTLRKLKSQKFYFEPEEPLSHEKNEKTE
ncbi:hypothetical protein KKF34_10275 [Myxococcota bacterium]|nr:hypothetical protein [Myxococcota bacterium]MBU1382657.1 hypothetical protein [Myxococcota bacterium]MBU1497251.1 hypothetical protein [Myxococcota bacterium]